MPPNKGSAVDDLAHALVTAGDRRTDRRIDQTVPRIERGQVISTGPLIIKPEYLDYHLTAPEDVMVAGDAVFAVGDPVVIISDKSGVWTAVPLSGGQGGNPDDTGTGAEPGSGSSPSASNGASVTVDGPAQSRILQTAEHYAGEHIVESPPGSNGGNAKIEQWQDLLGIGRAAWCAAFVAGIYKEAQVTDDLDQFHGAVSTLFNNFKDNRPNTILNSPIPGCLVCKSGGGFTSDGHMIHTNSDHVNIFISGTKANAVCIGGNQSDAVSKRTQSVAGSEFRYIAPRGLLDPTPSAGAPTGSGMPAGNYPNNGGTPGAAAPPINKTTYVVNMDSTRRSETTAYSKRHYGENTYVLDPKAIVMHYTAGPSAASAFSTFAAHVQYNGEYPNVTSHFIIDTDAIIYQVVSPTIRGRHAIGINHRAVGVECAGFSDAVLTGAMRTSALRLCRYLMSKYGIQLQDVVGHDEVNGHRMFMDKTGIKNDHHDMSNSTMNAFRTDLRGQG